MNRPRFSTLIAGALVLVAVLLAATAVLMERAGAPRGGKIVVTVRLWAEPIASAYRESFEAFNRAHPNIEVRTNLVAFSTYFDTLRTDVAGGSADDIFWLSNAYLAAYADSGRLMNIDTAGASAWEPAVVDQFTRGGKLWGVPQLTDAGIAVFYNADLLAAARKEGKVVLYTANFLDTEQTVSKRFAQAFPGIQIEIVRAPQFSIS